MHPHPQSQSEQRKSDLGTDMEECIKACLECARACQQARAYAQGKGKSLSSPELLEMLLDCSESCELSARWMKRGSPFHGDLCSVCATICKSCADACAAWPDDEALASCAEACRRCFDTCLRMGQASAHALVQ